MQVTNNEQLKQVTNTNKQQVKSPGGGEPKIWRRLATNFRRKRFVFFKSLISSLPRPIHILDVGGTQEFWETMDCIDDELKIIIYNVKPMEVTYPNFSNMVGDARNMKEFQEGEFDIVFSNSAIEHVGTFEQQRQMAEEVQRVGKRYYVQTPNRYFPIEPHFLIPFFQFLPIGLRAFIVSHFKTPWGFRFKDKQKALRYVEHIRLMTESELKDLFPGAKIYKEKVLGITKSFIVYKGW